MLFLMLLLLVQGLKTGIQNFMIDDCYSLKERDTKGRIVEGRQLSGCRGL